MTYSAAINFLAQNPWVLAACALITLWPITRATLRIIAKLAIKFDSLTFGKIKLPDESAKRCMESTSYFLAITILYASYIVLLIWVKNIANEIQPSLKASEASMILQVSRFLLSWISINSSILIGAILGELMRLSIIVKRTIEAEKQ